jgi:hypothetical protein
MDWFAIPESLEDSTSVALPATAALLFSLPIFLYRNSGYGGVAPTGANQWKRAGERMLATIALLFAFASAPSKSAVIGGIAFWAAALLLVIGYSSVKPRGKICIVCGWTSLLLALVSGFLFPSIE